MTALLLISFRCLRDSLALEEKSCDKTQQKQIGMHGIINRKIFNFSSIFSTCKGKLYNLRHCIAPPGYLLPFTSLSLSPCTKKNSEASNLTSSNPHGIRLPTIWKFRFFSRNRIWFLCFEFNNIEKQESSICLNNLAVSSISNFLIKYSIQIFEYYSKWLSKYLIPVFSIKGPYEKSASSKTPTKIFLDFCPEIFCSFLGASW